MPPRIVRPRSDRSLWPVVSALGLACVAGGYVAGARVFNPGPQAGSADESGSSPGAEPAGDGAEPGTSTARDAGNTVAATAHPVVAPVVVPPPPAPRVSVRVNRGVTQSCGDGEELNIPGARCEVVAGAEDPIRHYLERLGDCPGADAAAATPSAVLSIGLRVDYARHRVTALPGRSSSLHNAMTFVPCARAAFDHADDLWRLAPPHPRYLYFFSLRFGVTEINPGGSPAPAPAAINPGGSPGQAPAINPGGSPAPTPAINPGGSPGQAPAINPGGSPGQAPAINPGGSPPVHGTPLAPPETAIVVWDRVVVRDAPRTGAIVGRLARGEQVTLLARAPGWFEIRMPSGTGWVFGAAVGR